MRPSRRPHAALGDRRRPRLSALARALLHSRTPAPAARSPPGGNSRGAACSDLPSLLHCCRCTQTQRRSHSPSWPQPLGSTPPPSHLLRRRHAPACFVLFLRPVAGAR